MMLKGISQTSFLISKYIHATYKGNNKFNEPSLQFSSRNINLDHNFTTVIFMIPFGNILFPMLTAEWLHQVHNTSPKNIITLDRIVHCQENSIYVFLFPLFLFWELRSLSLNFHIHVSVSDLYIYSQDPSTYFTAADQAD